MTTLLRTISFFSVNPFPHDKQFQQLRQVRPILPGRTTRFASITPIAAVFAAEFARIPTKTPRRTRNSREFRNEEMQSVSCSPATCSSSKSNRSHASRNFCSFLKARLHFMVVPPSEVRGIANFCCCAGQDSGSCGWRSPPVTNNPKRVRFTPAANF